MRPLLDRQLIFVTGKGGVGKTTVAAAIGLATAARGRRVIVCELAAQERISDVFGREAIGAREERLADDLWGTSIDPQEALREWLGAQLGSRTLVSALTASNAFAYFVAAAPGAKELVTITKVWELAQAERWRSKERGYDTVIVDAPSSGHALGMLRAPKTFGDIARVGPIAKQSGRVVEFLADHERTGYVAVSQATEMPVTETIELEARLDEQAGRTLDAVVVNGVYPRRFSGADAEQIDALDVDDRPQRGAGRTRRRALGVRALARPAIAAAAPAA